MSRPLPSGSIFSIRMVFAQSTHEMSAVSGLWSSFMGGATSDMTKSYLGQRPDASHDFKGTGWRKNSQQNQDDWAGIRVDATP
jgi:hypothetical protein